MSKNSTPQAFTFGLQARILFSYAVGGLAISLLLAAVTLTFARQQLVDDREASAAAIAVNIIKMPAVFPSSSDSRFASIAIPHTS